MTTAEEAVRSRTQQESEALKARREAIAAQQRDEHAKALERFATAIESAAGRLGANNFQGGQMKKKWVGGTATSDVAVWYLPTSLFAAYWFAPSLRKVLTSPLKSDEDVRQHSKDVTNKRMHPAQHHAVASHWLLEMSDEPYRSTAEALTQALDTLASNA